MGLSQKVVKGQLQEQADAKEGEMGSTGSVVDVPKGPIVQLSPSFSLSLDDAVWLRGDPMDHDVLSGSRGTVVLLAAGVASWRAR